MYFPHICVYIYLSNIYICMYYICIVVLDVFFHQTTWMMIWIRIQCALLSRRKRNGKAFVVYISDTWWSPLGLWEQEPFKDWSRNICGHDEEIYATGIPYVFEHNVIAHGLNPSGENNCTNCSCGRFTNCAQGGYVSRFNPQNFCGQIHCCLIRAYSKRIQRSHNFYVYIYTHI